MSAKTSESQLLRDDDLHHVDSKTVRDTGGLPDESGTIAPPETDSVRHARTGRIGELPGPWTCHAKPASTGKTCGHVNATETRWRGLVCCEACGCTKAASDHRESKAVGRG